MMAGLDEPLSTSSKRFSDTMTHRSHDTIRSAVGVALLYSGAATAVVIIQLALRTCQHGNSDPLWGIVLTLICYLAGSFCLAARPTRWQFVLATVPLLPIMVWHGGYAIRFFLDHMGDGWPACDSLSSLEYERSGTDGGLSSIWLAASIVPWLGLGIAFCRMRK